MKADSTTPVRPLVAGQAHGRAARIIFAAVMVFCCLGVVCSQAQPVNDGFANRLLLTGTNAMATGSNVGATREPGEPNHAGNAGGASVWWSWTAPSSGPVFLSTAGSGFNTLLAVYAGSSVSTLTAVASNNDAPDGPDQTSKVLFKAISNQTYQIAVDGPGGAAGSVQLLLVLLPQTANDNFANRLLLTGTNVLATNSNVGATREPGEPYHAGVAGGASLWWAWKAPSSGNYTLSTAGSSFNTLLAVYTGSSVSALTAVASNDDNPDAYDGSSMVMLSAVSNQTYQIAVDGSGGAAGSVRLLLISQPVNDDFAHRRILTGTNVVAAGSNVGATKEPGEPDHGFIGSAGVSVWYSWTAPASGTVTISTAGSSFNTVLAVYTGSSVSALTEVASNEDNLGAADNTSMVVFSAVSNQTYQIAVDGWYEIGSVQLRIHLCRQAQPVNDSFAQRIPLTGADVLTIGSNEGATQEPGEPNHAGSPAEFSIWWSWTAPASGMVSISTAGSGFNTRLAVYTGASVSALTEVASNEIDPYPGHPMLPWTSAVLFRTISNQTYQIAVDGHFGDTRSVQLRVHLATPTTRYVCQGSPNPSPPYTDWPTAAANIQDAVDVAEAGDTVLVAPGAYDKGVGEGAPLVSGARSDARVAIFKPITVRSLQGPGATRIVGEPPYVGENWVIYGVRCACLVANAVLSGFTLTNGHTTPHYETSYPEDEHGGGALCEASGVLTNCVLIGNSADFRGGGVYGGTLYNCTVTGNSASYGGGAFGAALYNCTVAGNLASEGGGVYGGTLHNCTLTGNSATDTCYACGIGGGASGDPDFWPLTLNNCTVTGNSALQKGGGVTYGTLNNCIVYYNTAPTNANYFGCDFAFSCTLPLPDSGKGNISAEPALASAIHLSPQSPCIGRGSVAFSEGVDIDGEAWRDPPSIGADEFVAGGAGGPLAVSIEVTCTNVKPDSIVSFLAQIGGWPETSVWDFGDGVVVSNRPFMSHAWQTLGEYVVRLSVYNASYPAGLSATVAVHVVPEPVYYVNAANPTPAYPYTQWQSAATTIQAAIDAGTAPGRLVLVTNGVYGEGGVLVAGAMTNRVALRGGVVVQSVGGPAVTFIVGAAGAEVTGAGAIRCAYVGNDAVLSGFTLTNGHTLGVDGGDENVHGGGAWCEASGVLSNCVLHGNWAGEDGGGAYGGILSHCTLSSNAANGLGGGVYSATLNDCTLTANSSAQSGGAAGDSRLTNCTLAGNSAAVAGGGASGGTLHDCTLIGNRANGVATSLFTGGFGGGADSATLNHCILSGNRAGSGNVPGYGGGAYGGTLNDCTLTGNSASYGGGAGYGTLNACKLATNFATNAGGGAYNGTLSNCTLTGNSASHGGGAHSATLNNCTLTANAASGSGGGALAGTLNNCIIYFNTAGSGPNYFGNVTLNYCCTTPDRGGSGNITNEPLFVDRLHGNLRLQSNSPCINAGNNAYVAGTTDLDGRPRIVGGTVDMGAYEWEQPCCFQTVPPPGPGGFELCLSAATGRVIEIYASSNLVDWLLLVRRTNTTGRVTYTDPLSPSPPARFYKAVNP
jgi:hypothetical protein